MLIAEILLGCSRFGRLRLQWFRQDKVHSKFTSRIQGLHLYSIFVSHIHIYLFALTFDIPFEAITVKYLTFEVNPLTWLLLLIFCFPREPGWIRWIAMEDCNALQDVIWMNPAMAIGYAHLPATAVRSIIIAIYDKSCTHNWICHFYVFDCDLRVIWLRHR